MIFCAKFYFSAQMATMAIGNAIPGYFLELFVVLAIKFCIFSSPEQKLRVSYCHHPMSVVVRRPSYVVRRQQLVC